MVTTFLFVFREELLAARYHYRYLRLRVYCNTAWPGLTLRESDNPFILRKKHAGQEPDKNGFVTLLAHWPGGPRY